MKNLRRVLITVLLVVIALLFWRWRSLGSPSPSTAAAPPLASVSTQKPQDLLSSSASPTPGLPSLTTAPAPPISKREQMGNLLSSADHKDIEFYGKVVHQHGAPLADVEVYASVIYNSG